MATSAITVSSSGKTSTVQDPDAILDYPFNWSDWLADITDTYLSHQFKTVDPEGFVTPIEVVSSSELDGVITAFIGGGTLGMTHQVTCHIVTAGGREDDKTLFLKIKEE